MPTPDRSGPFGRRFERRVQEKGLRPRFAAYVITVSWTIGVVIFGVVMHWVDPETFDTVWLAMWWAIQTVTTVGYGDVVPADPAGKVMAGFLMLGGLSLYAVVTGVITSMFVARAQAERRASEEDPLMLELRAMSGRLDALQAEVARLERRGE